MAEWRQRHYDARRVYAGSNPVLTSHWQCHGFFPITRQGRDKRWDNKVVNIKDPPKESRQLNLTARKDE